MVVTESKFSCESKIYHLGCQVRIRKNTSEHVKRSDLEVDVGVFNEEQFLIGLQFQTQRYVT